MRRFTVRSFEGVGPLVFGMTRTDVRRVLGAEYQEFQKTPDSVTLSDQFSDPLLEAFYDIGDRLEAVEVSDEIAVDWNGILLIGRPAKAIFDDVKPHSNHAEVDHDGVTFHDLGFGFYCPGWLEEESEMSQSVIAFKKQYYEA